MTYGLIALALILIGAGYLLGVRHGRKREEALKTELAEHGDKLNVIEQELFKHTAVDPATGLHTQQHFQEFLEREWRRASRDRRAVSIIMVEIDHFGALSDRHGPEQAAGCLKAVAAAIMPIVHRPSDVVSRYGGNGTFGVVLGGTDANAAGVVAERIREAVAKLKRPNPAAPPGAFTTVTLGGAAATPERNAAWQDIELIAVAERALSEAREAGRNVVVIETIR